MEQVQQLARDPAISIDQLTTAQVDGAGSFDTLMRAFKAHIDEEWQKNRLKGPEYSQVYLGGLQQVMQTALSFTMSQREQTLKNQLAEEQITLAKISQRAEEAKIIQIEAQTELIRQQKVNLQDELLTSAKQREKIDAEIENLKLQKEILAAQIIEMQQRGEMIKQQILNLKDELLTSIEQRKKIVQEVINLTAQLPLIQAQIREMDGRATLIAGQIRKIDAEILSEAATRERIAQEVILLQQKRETERAQTIAGVAQPGSVLGTQQAVQQGQANAFVRDGEQKAAQIMAQTWMSRRTTDEATQANSTNALDDYNVGRAMSKMLAGIGA